MDAFSAEACEVTVDPDGHVYTMPCGAGARIQVYAPSHALIGSWSGPDMILAASPHRVFPFAERASG